MWRNIVALERQHLAVWRMRIVYQLKKGNTHSLLFDCNDGCTDAPQCYVIHTLPVVLLWYEPFMYRSTAQYATCDSTFAVCSVGSRYPLNFSFNLFDMMGSLLKITVALHVTPTVNLM